MESSPPSSNGVLKRVVVAGGGVELSAVGPFLCPLPPLRREVPEKGSSE